MYQQTAASYPKSFNAPLALLSQVHLLKAKNKIEEARLVCEKILTDYRESFWSGEAAWKVTVELLRVPGFKAEDLWEMPFELPRAGTVCTLTNAWVHDGLAVKLAFVASPNSEIGTPFGWVPKWQAEDADLVYSLGLQFEAAMTNHWLSTLKMTDERGGLTKLMGQRGQSTRQQVVFFRPGHDVRMFSSM